MLEARRFTSLQALEVGLVDGLGGFEEAVEVMTDVEGGYGRGAVVVGVRGTKSVYGKLKEEIYKDVLVLLDLSEEGESSMLDERYKDRARREQEEKSLLQKIESQEKAKL